MCSCTPQCSAAGTCDTPRGDIWITRFVDNGAIVPSSSRSLTHAYFESLYFMLVTMVRWFLSLFPVIAFVQSPPVTIHTLLGPLSSTSRCQASPPLFLPVLFPVGRFAVACSCHSPACANAIPPQCTVGYGDITASNDVERQFMCVILLLAALCYAIVFGNIAVQVQQLDMVRGHVCVCASCSCIVAGLWRCNSFPDSVCLCVSL